MTRRRKPPHWFKWAIWSGIVLAVAVPTACVMNHGALPGHATFSALAH
jgi:hypothetical protein